MSSRRPPFHFDDGNPIDKRSDIWKRFGFNPEEDRRMFYECNSPANQGWPDWQSKFHRPPQFDDPEWRNRSMFNEPGSSSPSFARRMRMGPNWTPDEEIPIRVVHEKTPPMDDGNDSETSSQASHGSQGSGASGTGQPMKAKISREPRVHHIPIMVEPRDGSTSSGYASDGGGGNQNNSKQQSVNRQGSSNMSKQNSVDSNMDTEDYPAPNVQKLKKNFEQGHSPEKRRESTVHTIPIKVLHEESQGATASSPRSRQPPARSFSANSFGTNHSDMPTSPRQRKASSHPPMSSPSTNCRPNGPHVTKIPVNTQQHQKREISPEASSQHESNSRVKSTPSPLDEIKGVLDELNAYQKQINEFQGKPQDKAYKYLDEMLTRLMLKLDNVETNGQDNIRQARKAAVREIESWISILESKANGNVSNNTENATMEADSETERTAEDKSIQDTKMPQSEAEEHKQEEMSVDQKLEEVQNMPRSRDESMETDLQKVSSSEKCTSENVTKNDQPITKEGLKDQ